MCASSAPNVTLLNAHASRLPPSERLQQQITTLQDELDKAEEASEQRLEEMQVRRLCAHELDDGVAQAAVDVLGGQKTLTQLREKHRKDEDDLEDQLAAVEDENDKLKKELGETKAQADKWRKMAECMHTWARAPTARAPLPLTLCGTAAPAGEEDIASARTKPTVLEEEVRRARAHVTARRRHST
jgi:DNA repair exonuclease SbcCD ATPase subunit